MRMHVDQARQQRHAGQIDPARTRRYLTALRAHRTNSAIGDDNLRVIHHAAGDHVQHAIGGDNYSALFLCIRKLNRSGCKPSQCQSG